MWLSGVLKWQERQKGLDTILKMGYICNLCRSHGSFGTNGSPLLSPVLMTSQFFRFLKRLFFATLTLFSLPALKVEGSMIAPSHSVARIAACFCALLLLSTTGCLNSGMYRNYPGAYGQPMYAPPQSINPAAPGNLYIPESQAPAYNPGGSTGGFEETFDEELDDDFSRPPEDRFFEPSGGGDDDVPRPREPAFKNLDDLGVEYRPENSGGNIRQVSDVRGPREYGFDTLEYRWLLGTIQRDPKSRRWLVNYSTARSDQYRGMLSLEATGQQLVGLRSGDWIDVRGQLHSSRKDRSGRPLFVVDSIVRLDP